MCGICGIYSPKNRLLISKSIIKRMVARLKHRGPDNSKIWINSKIAFAHTRLSILDLSEHGNQPMFDNDGRFIIIYNGEIYNYLNLKKELEQMNVVFRGSSDTEVILSAFSVWKTSLLPKLNGIFAFAIWDNLEEELFIVRDRFGVKPLYYYKCNEGIIFGSEIKSILESGYITTSIYPQSLHEYIYYGTTLGSNTIFNGIKKLNPGQYMYISKDICKTETYWSVNDIKLINDNLDTIVYKTRFYLEKSVKNQLISDVPLGIFLSGGLDSSAITAFASKHYAGKLNTYTATFDFCDNYADILNARIISQYFSTKHNEIHIECNNLVEVINDLVTRHDEPFADAANIPLYLMCKEINGNPKVILQGDGGDEVFAGYRRYSLLYYLKFFSFISIFLHKSPDFNNNYLKRLKRIYGIFSYNDPDIIMAELMTTDTETCSLYNILSDYWKDILKGTDPFRIYRKVYSSMGEIDPVQKMLYADMQIKLPNGFLEKVDKSTMSFGVESRVPFLDNDLVDYVMGVQTGYKVRFGKKKYLLKRSLEGILPKKILKQSKAGFGVPYNYWIRYPLRNYVRDVFNYEITSKDSLFDKRMLDIYINEHQKTGYIQYGYILWKALQLSIWKQCYLNN